MSFTSVNMPRRRAHHTSADTSANDNAGVHPTRISNITPVSAGTRYRTSTVPSIENDQNVSTQPINHSRPSESIARHALPVLASMKPADAAGDMQNSVHSREDHYPSLEHQSYHPRPFRRGMTAPPLWTGTQPPAGPRSSLLFYNFSNFSREHLLSIRDTPGGDSACRRNAIRELETRDQIVKKEISFVDLTLDDDDEEPSQQHKLEDDLDDFAADNEVDEANIVQTTASDGLDADDQGADVVQSQDAKIVEHAHWVRVRRKNAEDRIRQISATTSHKTPFYKKRDMEITAIKTGLEQIRAQLGDAEGQRRVWLVELEDLYRATKRLMREELKQLKRLMRNQLKQLDEQQAAAVTDSTPGAPVDADTIENTAQESGDQEGESVEPATAENETQPRELTLEEKLRQHALNPDFNSPAFQAYRAKQKWNYSGFPSASDPCTATTTTSTALDRQDRTNATDAAPEATRKKPKKRKSKDIEHEESAPEDEEKEKRKKKKRKSADAGDEDVQRHGKRRKSAETTEPEEASSTQQLLHEFVDEQVRTVATDMGPKDLKEFAVALATGLCSAIPLFRKR